VDVPRSIGGRRDVLDPKRGAALKCGGAEPRSFGRGSVLREDPVRELHDDDGAECERLREKRERGEGRRGEVVFPVRAKKELERRERGAVLFDASLQAEY